MTVSTMAATQTPLKQLLSTLTTQDPMLDKAPKKVASGPFWARLPPIRPRESSSQSNESQNTNATGTGGVCTMPPIIAPDRIGTMRVLLQDTQACVQKFATRMDKLSAAVEQGVKDVQMCRTTMEDANEKVISDITDVVYKSQAILVKELEAYKAGSEKSNEHISQLNSKNESLTRLYDAQSVSLQSLSQMYQTQQATLQTIQEQQYKVILSLAPLEPLVNAIPLQFEAKQANLKGEILDAMKSEIPRALEATLLKMDLGSVISRLAAASSSSQTRFMPNNSRQEDSALGASLSHAPEYEASFGTPPKKRKRSDSGDENTDNANTRRKMVESSTAITSFTASVDTDTGCILTGTSDTGPPDQALISSDIENRHLSDHPVLSNAPLSEESANTVRNERIPTTSESPQTNEDNSGRLSPSQSTQRCLHFRAQKFISRQPTLAPLERTQTVTQSQDLQQAQISSSIAHIEHLQETSGDVSVNGAANDDIPKPASFKSAISTVASLNSSSTVTSNKSKKSAKNKGNSRPTGKRKETKRIPPSGVVQDQNIDNVLVTKDKAPNKLKAKSVTPPRLNATSSNEISVTSEHDPPNSPTKQCLPTGSEPLGPLTDINAIQVEAEVGSRKRMPLTPLHLTQRPSQQNNGQGQITSSSTLIDLLGDNPSPDWNMADAADAMNKAERDLDPLSMIPSSDGFLVTGDPSSSVIRAGGRQRRYLVLENDSPDVDLWFDDLLDV